MTGDLLECDVVVIGGGPSGIGAALGAARLGARTILLERHSIPGGMGTAALVNNFLPAHMDGRRLIIGGVFAQLRQRLINRRSIYYSADHAKPVMESYDPEAFVEVVMEMCREERVHLLLSREYQAIDFLEAEGAFVSSQGIRIKASVVVDATGDATVAYRAGVPCQFGRSTDGAVMPLTYCFRLKGIDLEVLQREMPECVKVDGNTGERYCDIGWHPEINKFIQKARSNGELSIPIDRIPAMAGIPKYPGEATVNFGRVECKDPTNPHYLAEAEEKGRHQIEEALTFFRMYLPGFSKVSLLEVARQIGVRQSRQIEGLYTLTGTDCKECRQFDDVVAQCCYALDFHEPGTDRFTLITFAEGTHFDIPWRCLIPREGPENLIVAGRCISATWEAMSSFRVAPSVMAIGEAAGVTAALAAQQGCPVRSVNWKSVQQALKDNGAILT